MFLFDPLTIFKWFDIFLALVIYVLAIISILRYRHGYIIPMLIFGLFIFPIQFSIWFVPNRFFDTTIMGFRLIEIIYLLLLKFLLLVSLILT